MRTQQQQFTIYSVNFLSTFFKRKRKYVLFSHLTVRFALISYIQTYEFYKLTACNSIQTLFLYSVIVYIQLPPFRIFIIASNQPV